MGMFKRGFNAVNEEKQRNIKTQIYQNNKV